MLGMKLHPVATIRSSYFPVRNTDFDLPGNSGKSVTRRFKSRVGLATLVNTAMETNLTPCTRLLRLAEVVELTSLSASLIYGLIREGQFPAPLKLSANRRAWCPEALRDWVASRHPEAYSSAGSTS